MPEVDSYTLSVVAKLVRDRIAHLKRDERIDGLEKLGAERYLTQLANDLEVSAKHAKRRPTRLR